MIYVRSIKTGEVLGIFANEAQAVLAAAIHDWRNWCMEREIPRVNDLGSPQQPHEGGTRTL